VAAIEGYFRMATATDTVARRLGRAHDANDGRRAARRAADQAGPAVTETREFVLSSGARCRLSACPLPLLPTYHVLTKVASDVSTDDRDEEEMLLIAQRMARELGKRFYYDPGCFTILFNGTRARRRPWPHFHILAVRNVGQKRRALLLLHAKRLLKLLLTGKMRLAGERA
jgi:hypothetical protein